jgi:beta-N-acetylhexosaminidase
MKSAILIPVVLIIGVFIFKYSTGIQDSTAPVNNTTNKNYGEIYSSNLSPQLVLKLQQMTLREKIAQMVIANIIPENVDVNSAEFKKYKSLCEKTKVGGFIFFKGSMNDYVRVSNALQSYSETPLLLSADFERGIKMRVTDGAIFPNNMAIGATDNPELAYKMGKEVARQTRLIGIHQNYAPVCDVNNNPNNPIINVRSFGEDPNLVSKMSESMIKGLQEGGVIATAKHFPGHGDTEIDSHNDLPVLNFSMDRLNSIELVPFKNAIDKKVMSVMIAHLSFPELETDTHIPASLSSNIIQGLLIDKMGFNGLVVTDALNMKGITKYYSTEEVAVMCVNAGIDLILMPLSEVKTVNAIESAVISGNISEERINRSVEKILKAKEWAGLFNNKYVSEENVQSNAITGESSALSQQIADESITLVKDENKVLPINPSSKTLVVIISEGGESDNTSYLKSNAGEYLQNYDIISSNEMSNINPANYEKIIMAVYAKVRYGTGKISISPENAALISNISGSHSGTIVLSLGSPYLLKEFPSVNSYICAYGDSDVSITAALKCVTGKQKFKGKLPVTISDTYKTGFGIQK